MTSKPRKYDLIVFGATGYTGKLVSQQILAHTPSTLKWAIAGRSPHKLSLFSSDYNRQYPDRVPCETFIADLSEHAIEQLAGATKLLISTVGPYIKYGTPVLEACAVFGTHYVDCTAEFPWVCEMIKKCHKTAQKRGAVIIPQSGFESAPADLGTYMLAKTIREATGLGMGDVRISLHDIKSSPSGGTLETGTAMFEHATLQEVIHAQDPQAFAVKEIPDASHVKGPIVRDPDLGLLTMNFSNTADKTVVYRSWSLWDDDELSYGPNFSWNMYQRTTNYLAALLWPVICFWAMFLPLFAPMRWIIRKMLRYAPGDGPTEEQRKGYFVEWRGVAEVDEDVEKPRKAFLRMSTKMGVDGYELTAALLVQTAMGILFGKDTRALKLGGGCLTPSCVANPVLFRELEAAGFRIECRMEETGESSKEEKWVGM